MPMGGNAGPDIADLVPAVMEYKYSMITTSEQQHFYRYVDDLLPFDYTTLQILLHKFMETISK